MSDLVRADLSFDQVGVMLTQQLTALQVHHQKIKELDAVKADRRDVRALEAEVADLQAELQRVNHSRDYLTVVALESLVKIKFEDRSKTGAELSQLCKRLSIDKVPRPDDRFGSVGTYHPYVCRVYCELRGYPLPPLLKYATDPR